MDRDVICLSSVDWDFVWQGHQEVMARLAERGSRVLFVENTGVRRPQARDLPRLLRRLLRWSRAAAPSSGPVPAGITILSPLALPFPWSRWSRVVNRVLLVRAVRRQARQLRDPLIWTFLPTPSVIDTIRACRTERSTVIYYCVADFSELTDDVIKVEASEDELLREADLVFVNGQSLYERFVHRHPRVRVYPFGVDLRAFRAGRYERPADLARLAPPLAGYVGGIHRHLAVDWLTQAARALPDVAFVLVGPVQTEIGTLSALPNVHLLGQKNHELLAAYVANFDVCLIPYALTRYTVSVVPTKLFEYMAMGKPCVSTSLPELAHLPLPEGAVSVAGDPMAFADAIRSSVQRPEAEGTARQREAFARRYSWDALVDSMLRDVDSVRRTA